MERTDLPIMAKVEGDAEFMERCLYVAAAIEDLYSVEWVPLMMSPEAGFAIRRCTEAVITAVDALLLAPYALHARWRSLQC